MAAEIRQLVARRVLTPDGWVRHAAVTIDDGRVTSVRSAEGSSPDVDVLLPAFVDLQVNGIDDIDIARADGHDWEHLDRSLLAHGVTSWCPTLVTGSLDAYAAPLARIAHAAVEPSRRTRIIGAHLEGPFLGSAHGAHRSEFVATVDLDWLAELPAIVRLMTIGPEQSGAPGAIHLLRSRGVQVAIGHTRATDRELDDAIQAGATMVTHLFNAMSGLHHREPGVAAWVLTHPSVAASLIADGVHVHPQMLRLAATVLGGDRTVLVTDAVAWSARRAGPLSGIEMRDGAPRLDDGTLAGSALTMDAAVRNAVAAGIELGHAARAASTVPARIMGLADRGRIENGCVADLVALDDALQVVGTWVGGRST